MAVNYAVRSDNLLKCFLPKGVLKKSPLDNSFIYKGFKGIILSDFLNAIDGIFLTCGHPNKLPLGRFLFNMYKDG